MVAAGSGFAAISMSIWGKIIGGAAGFALGGPLGALLGALAGHAADKYVDGEIPAIAGPDGQPGGAQSPDDRAATRQVAFTVAVIALGAKMAKADGQVDRSEIAAFKEVFQVPASETANVARVFDLAKRDSRGFEPYAQQIAKLFRKGHPVLEELLDGLFHIARADGKVHDSEIAYLAEVARLFGFTEGDFARIREANVGPDTADPYTILGVTRAMSNEEIRAAWRKLARDNHPDRLIAQGLPEEFVTLANQKLATINAAYDKV